MYISNMIKPEKNESREYKSCGINTDKKDQTPGGTHHVVDPAFVYFYFLLCMLFLLYLYLSILKSEFSIKWAALMFTYFV